MPVSNDTAIPWAWSGVLLNQGMTLERRSAATCLVAGLGVGVGVGTDVAVSVKVGAGRRATGLGVEVDVGTGGLVDGAWVGAWIGVGPGTGDVSEAGRSSLEQATSGRRTIMRAAINKQYRNATDQLGEFCISCFNIQNYPTVAPTVGPSPSRRIATRRPELIKHKGRDFSPPLLVPLAWV